MRYVVPTAPRAWNPPAPRPPAALAMGPRRGAVGGAMLAALLGAACGLGLRLNAPALLAEPLMAPAPGEGLRIVLAPSEPVPSPVCVAAQSLADELVCNDPALALEDQRLAITWRETVAAGVPVWRLRRGQERWIAQRENAAYEQPDLLPALYERRISELQRLGAACCEPPPEPAD